MASTTKTQGQWTDQQKKYIDFLARGKKDKLGNDKTEQQFADVTGVDFATLWRWKQKDGFAEALLEATQRNLAPLLPSLSNAVTGKAFGEPRFKKIDIPAATLAIKLMGVAERRQVKADVENQHSGTIGVELSHKSDEELDKIIQGAA